MKSIDDAALTSGEDSAGESIGDAATTSTSAEEKATKSDKPKKARRDEQMALSKSRTSCSLDRTLLAWVRTCLHLIVFGFILYKFIQSLASHGELMRGINPGFAKVIGLSLVILGVGGLTTGIVEYLGQIRKLKSILDTSALSASLAVAVTLAVIGSSLLAWLITDLM